MNISLPPPIQEWVEAQAGRAGTTAEEYVVAVLSRQIPPPGGGEADAILLEALADGDLAQVSGEDMAALKRSIEVQVQAALASGPALAVTPKFWAERRRVLAERLSSPGAEEL